MVCKTFATTKLMSKGIHSCSRYVCTYMNTKIRVLGCVGSGIIKYYTTSILSKATSEMSNWPLRGFGNKTIERTPY